MKKLLLAAIASLPLLGCATSSEYPDAGSLDVSFVQPSTWGTGFLFWTYFPAGQLCHGQGGHPSTPTLFVSDIPDEANLIILEMNNLSDPALAENGGLGAIGFYHNENENTATLLPVSGEKVSLPERERKYAFKEHSARITEKKPYAYMPPCTPTGDKYSATVKAVRRTGSFDTQKTEVLAIGTIYLGENIY